MSMDAKPNPQRELAEAIQRFTDRTDALLRRTDANSNTATISINAGGVGVWIAATACAVMLACNVFLAALVIDHARRLSDLDAYLAAIYMQAPHLKPAENADKEK